MRGVISIALAFSASGAAGLSGAYVVKDVRHEWLLAAIALWWLAGMFLGASIQKSLKYK